jgi:quercetin dioxygenase-like cupin family protein
MNALRIASGVAVLCMLASNATAQPAFGRSADDPGLQWGGCPEFMPEGCQLAVLNGDPAQANADVLLRVPPQSHIARHWHSSNERMVLVAGEMEVSYDHQAPITARPGDYMFGPARLPHDARCRSPQPCVLFIAFEGPVDAHPGAPGD